MSSLARGISALEKCANLCTLDAAVTSVAMLLWLQLSLKLCVGLSPHLDINQDFFTEFLEKDHCGPISDKMLFGLNQIYPQYCVWRSLEE